MRIWPCENKWHLKKGRGLAFFTSTCDICSCDLILDMCVKRTYPTGCSIWGCLSNGQDNAIRPSWAAFCRRAQCWAAPWLIGALFPCHLKGIWDGRGKPPAWAQMLCWGQSWSHWMSIILPCNMYANTVWDLHHASWSSQNLQGCGVRFASWSSQNLQGWTTVLTSIGHRSWLSCTLPQRWGPLCWPKAGSPVQGLPNMWTSAKFVSCLNERERLQCFSQPANLITEFRKWQLYKEIKTFLYNVENLHVILQRKERPHSIGVHRNEAAHQCWSGSRIGHV